MNILCGDGEPKKPEILAPGGSYEKCRIAFHYGADAVYAAGKSYGLRGYAKNLDMEEMAACATLARSLGKKFYAAVNIFAREPDLADLPAYLGYLQDIRVDALIVSDPGVLLLARRHAPGIPIHLSTQSNTTNSMGVRFWQEQGVRRINLSREIHFEELVEIRRNTGVELEVFVHGAMCISYSGRCLLSAFLNGRGANRGLCTQPCRWSYHLVEEKRPGQFFPIQEDDRGSYIFNSKDLRLLEEVGRLASLGVDSLKIEGRMKGALYLAAAVRSYRRAVDSYIESPDDYRVERSWVEDLDRMSHRPYTKGLLFPEAGDGDEGVDESTGYLQTHTLAAMVRPSPEGLMGHECARDNGGERLHPTAEDNYYARPDHWTTLEVRSRLVPGRTLEFLNPDGSTAEHALQDFTDLAGNPLTVAHPNTWIRLRLPFPTFPLQVVRMSA